MIPENSPVRWLVRIYCTVWGVGLFYVVIAKPILYIVNLF